MAELQNHTNQIVTYHDHIMWSLNNQNVISFEKRNLKAAPFKFREQNVETKISVFPASFIEIPQAN